MTQQEKLKQEILQKTKDWKEFVIYSFLVVPRE